MRRTLLILALAAFVAVANFPHPPQQPNWVDMQLPTLPEVTP